MQFQESKKLERRSSFATTAHGATISRLYKYKYKSSGRDYLIDTGADISVIPPNSREKGNTPGLFKLFAANGSQIKTFGSKTITLNLGLRRPIRWIFVIADVKSPIDSDLIDVKNNTLRDGLTNIPVQGKLTEVSIGNQIKSVSDQTAYHQLIQEFPDVLDLSSIRKFSKTHNVTHKIITNCQPIFSKPRRLNAEKLKIAKAEFEKMLEVFVDRQIVPGLHRCISLQNHQVVGDLVATIDV